MARAGLRFEQILACFQHCNPGCDLRGLAPLAHRQQRLATVLGSAYWQNLQCIFVMTVQVDEFSTTSLGPLAVTERLGEMRQQLVEVAVADPANQL